MRLLFLSLLFANLALFAWTRWLAPGASAAAASPALEVPRILLAGESPAANAQDPVAAAAGAGEAAEGGDADAAATDADGMRCVSVGPMTDLDAAARVNGVLVELGYQPRQRPADGPVPDGWLVLVGDLADTGAQADVERRLKRGGLDDAVRLPATDGALAVSAGLFSERRRAERRAEVVRKIGLTPSIAPRLKPGTVYWIDIDLRNAADAESLQAMQLGDGGLRIEPCVVEPVAADPG
ncbi:MAG: hypothetical protein R3E65_09620 [Steroidobacteraceae bacterium]